MKALTVWQPWASLIAEGNKRYETRSWATKYRGVLAIHAAKRDPLLTLGPINDVVARMVARKIGRINLLPLSAIVAVADLVDVIPTAALLQSSEFLTADEVFFGDYRPGRFAWQLENIRRLREPVQTRGQQGLWNCPDDILEAI